MKDLIKILVNVIQSISFCAVMLSGVIGVVYEIVGHAKFEQILSMMGICKGFERIWIISAIMLGLLIVTYFIKVKFFAD